MEASCGSDTENSGPCLNRNPISKKLPFVGFLTRSHHSEKKIVRVQAAKASAAARKSTIRKRMERERRIETTTTAHDSARNNYQEISFQLPFMVKASSDITGIFRDHTWNLDLVAIKNPAARVMVTEPFSLSPKKPQPQADINETARFNQSWILKHQFKHFNSLDPFNSFNVVWMDWYDNLICHICTICAPCAWALLSITPMQGDELLQYVYQEARKEPALFFSHLLFHCDEAIRCGLLGCHEYYWLRQKALEELRKALGDESRAMSSGSILALGHIALHDYLHCSDKSAAIIHVLPYRYLVHACGGVDKLKFPEIISQMTLLSDNMIPDQNQAPQMVFPYQAQDHQLTSENLHKSFRSWIAYRERMALSSYLTLL